jgi:hypothetical protein
MAARSSCCPRAASERCCPETRCSAPWNRWILSGDGIGDVDPAVAQRTKENLAREIEGTEIFEGTEIKVAAVTFPA